MNAEDSLEEVEEAVPTNGAGTFTAVDHIELNEARYPNWEKWPLIDTAAKTLKVSRRHAYKLCKDGKVLRYLCKDGTMRFNPTELKAKAREFKLVKQDMKAELSKELGEPLDVPDGVLPETASAIALHVMQHNERLFQLTMKPLELSFDTLKDENASLRRQLEESNRLRLTVIETYEKLLSQQHERELMSQQAVADSARKERAAKLLFDDVGPLILAKLASKPADLERFKAGAQLLSSIGKNEWAAIIGSKFFSEEQVQLLRVAVGDPTLGAEEKASEVKGD